MRCDGHGKMDTRPRMGARYYHIYKVMVMVRWTLGPEWVLVVTIEIIGTPFCMVTSLLFFIFLLDMGYISFFFLHATLLEREVTNGVLFCGMDG
jgi:hypothetical protein